MNKYFQDGLNYQSPTCWCDPGWRGLLCRVCSLVPWRCKTRAWQCDMTCTDMYRYNQIQSDTLDLTGILCICEHLSLQVHPVHPGRVSRETALSCTCCTIPSGLKLGMGRRRRWKLKPSWLLQTTMLAWVVSFWMVFFSKKVKMVEMRHDHHTWQIRDYRKTGSSYSSSLRQVRKNGMRITIDKDSRYGFHMI